MTVLNKIRHELAVNHAKSAKYENADAEMLAKYGLIKGMAIYDFQSGFSAAVALMQEREEDLIEEIIRIENDR